MKNKMGDDLLSKMERARKTQEQFKRAVAIKFEVQQQKVLEAREVKSKLAESRPALRAASIKSLEKKEAHLLTSIRESRSMHKQESRMLEEAVS